jgi:hypothetical protein
MSAPTKTMRIEAAIWEELEVRAIRPFPPNIYTPIGLARKINWATGRCAQLNKSAFR